MSSTSPLAAFTGTIRPAKVPLLYRAGLFLVACCMVLLPLVYLSLVIGAAWAVWWHFTHNLHILELGRGWLSLVAYLGPGIAGAILVLFLVKPLFSRSTAASEPFKISPRTEPQLFAVVSKVCDLVGAPHPKEVRLDNNVNAAAALRRGWLSLFGSDLMLIIGMPLVAGMTMRQFVGVLAHEFGHFAQGGGMRFSYIIRSINNWFARVVYQRDSWDERLDAGTRVDSWPVQIVAYLAKGGVWVGRKVLWCLMNLGHAMSCFMSRQMEYDADAYEAKVAGSTEFPRTAERLRLLSLANQAAMSDAYESFQQRELPEDLAALTVWREKQFPADVKQKINDSSNQEESAWHHTHPSDKERISRTAALAEPGVFHLESPATELFVDFSSLSKAVTRHHFATDVGLDISKVQFRSMDSVLKDREAADKVDSHLTAFFGQHFRVTRAQPLPEQANTAQWNIYRTQMADAASAYGKSLKTYDELLQKCSNQKMGYGLLTFGYSLQTPGDFDLYSSNKDDSDRRLYDSEQKLKDLNEQMLSWEQSAYQRMAAALQLSFQTNKEPSQAEQLKRLVDVQRALAQVMTEIIRVIDEGRLLELGLANLENHSDPQIIERNAKECAARMISTGSHILARIGQLSHPFVEGHPPIISCLQTPDAEANEFGKAFQLQQVCHQALLPLMGRTTGELCGLALQAEATAQPFTPPLSV
jgi:Zn-dependent protease with chaperone function